MFKLYTPAPFPDPFPAGFDPWAAVYEVIDVDRDGALTVLSHRKRAREVPAARVAAGLALKVGDRVRGVEGPGFHIERLQPDPQERAYAQRWLRALRDAGLAIEGLDLDAVLVERLRTAPFGLATMPPLRPVLRGVLDELVGRYPQNESWKGRGAMTLARALLSQLGVNRLAEPADAPMQAEWEILARTADEANRALASAGSPLRWVPCEREMWLSLRAQHTGGAAEAQQPVWLVLVPSMVPALESAGIVRRYRGAAFPTAVGEVDPRVLGRRAAPSAAAPPPETPCLATVTRVFEDGSGELTTHGGLVVWFGRYACRFKPEPGTQAWIVVFVPDVRQGGYAAGIVHHADDRKLVDAMLSNRAAADGRQREQELLLRHGLGSGDEDLWDRLAALNAVQRRRLAADLIKLKRASHLFEAVFEELALLDPALFHPFLDELDWHSEPELLAWTGAPYRSVKRAAKLLARADSDVLLHDVPLGTVGPALEMGRRSRAPASEIAAAALALAYSAEPKAIAALAQWVRASRTPPGQVNELLAPTGWYIQDGVFHQLSGRHPAFHARADAKGRGRHFVPSAVACPACNRPLLRLFEGAPASIVAFPLFACPDCAMVSAEPYEVEVHSDGTPAPRSRPAPKWPHAPGPTPSTPVAITFDPAPRAVPFGGDRRRAFGRQVRVGGVPSWDPHQGPLVLALHCWRCERPTEFLAQFTHPRDFDMGLYYVFGCAPCRTSATVFERT